MPQTKKQQKRRKRKKSDRKVPVEDRTPFKAVRQGTKGRP